MRRGEGKGREGRWGGEGAHVGARGTGREGEGGGEGREVGR